MTDSLIFKPAQLDEALGRLAVDEVSLSDPEWFIKSHQPDLLEASNVEFVTLEEYGDAIKLSEQLMEQFAVDQKRVTSIAVSLFVKGEELYQVPQFLNFDGKLYVKGGRHRYEALVQSIVALVSQESLEQAKDVINRTVVAAFVQEVPTLEKVKAHIEHDNDSRKMTRYEKAHLSFQVQAGGSAKGATKRDFSTALKAEATKGERTAFIATLIARLGEKSSGLEKQARFDYGKSLYTLLTRQSNILLNEANLVTIAKEFWAQFAASIRKELIDEGYSNLSRPGSIQAALERFEANYLEPQLEAGNFLAPVVEAPARKRGTRKPKANEVSTDGVSAADLLKGSEVLTTIGNEQESFENAIA